MKPMKMQSINQSAPAEATKNGMKIAINVELIRPTVKTVLGIGLPLRGFSKFIHFKLRGVRNVVIVHSVRVDACHL